MQQLYQRVSDCAAAAAAGSGQRGVKLWTMASVCKRRRREPAITRD